MDRSREALWEAAEGVGGGGTRGVRGLEFKGLEVGTVDKAELLGRRGGSHKLWGEAEGSRGKGRPGGEKVGGDRHKRVSLGAEPRVMV